MEANLCRFLSFVYRCSVVGDPVISFVLVPIQDLDFQRHMSCCVERVMVRCVRFVDLGGIVERH